MSGQPREGLGRVLAKDYFPLLEQSGVVCEERLSPPSQIHDLRGVSDAMPPETEISSAGVVATHVTLEYPLVMIAPFWIASGSLTTPWQHYVEKKNRPWYL